MVLALPLVLLTIGAGLLALSSLDSALDPGIGDIIDRVTEPGFDPVNDADDEAFVESIDVSLTAGAIVGFGVAAILFLVGGTVVSLSFTVFLAALRRGRALGLGEIYGITLRRLPRFIGILLLWTLVASTVVFAALVVVAVAILITPWLLLLIGPLSIAAIIYLWPYGALAVTTLSVAPTDDPPFRRTVALIKPNWPFVALRLLVLTVVFAIISFGGSAVTTPFSAASVWAGFLVSMILRAVGSVMTTAGNVVLYDVAGGPFDPELTAE